MHPVAALVVCLFASTALVVADNGYNTDYHQCLGVPQLRIPNMCVGVHLDTCHPALQFNLTFNNAPVFSATIPNVATWTRCFQPPGFALCQSCFLFESTPILTPSYANLCPLLRTSCLGLKISDVPFPCLTLGVDCTSKSDCGSCLSTSNCGYCGNFTSGSCMIQGSNSPYCAECPANLWIANDGTCPGAPENSADAWTTVDRGLLIALPIGGGLLIIAFVGFCWHRKRRQPERAPPKGSMPLAEQDGESPGLSHHSVAVSVSNPAIPAHALPASDSAPHGNVAAAGGIN